MHFSRNPKIAAFMKDYGYVKEYGEGVDRMCRELEAVGLPNPIFNNDYFILKATVMSSAYIIKILDCSDRTARNLLAKLREMQVIVPVKGKAKGMYRFKYADETDIDGE